MSNGKLLQRIVLLVIAGSLALGFLGNLENMDLSDISTDASWQSWGVWLFSAFVTLEFLGVAVIMLPQMVRERTDITTFGILVIAVMLAGMGGAIYTISQNIGQRLIEATDGESDEVVVITPPTSNARVPAEAPSLIRRGVVQFDPGELEIREEASFYNCVLTQGRKEIAEERGIAIEFRFDRDAEEVVFTANPPVATGEQPVKVSFEVYEKPATYGCTELKRRLSE